MDPLPGNNQRSEPWQTTTIRCWHIARWAKVWRQRARCRCEKFGGRELTMTIYDYSILYYTIIRSDYIVLIVFQARILSQTDGSLVGTFQVVLPAEYEVAQSGQIGSWLCRSVFQVVHQEIIKWNIYIYIMKLSGMSSLCVVYDGLFWGWPREPGSECQYNAVRAQVDFLRCLLPFTSQGFPPLQLSLRNIRNWQ